uniref:Frizzled-8 n=1 Tax=Schistocephalus solidus TaxID=70667 RepID=A0A0X3PUU1_SCHSO
MMGARSIAVLLLLVYCQADAGGAPIFSPAPLTSKFHVVTTNATNRSERLLRAAGVDQMFDSTLLHNQWGNLPISEEASNAGGYSSSRCEPITVPLCKGVFYEHTRMPNMFNHETQEEAGLEAHQFYPLIQINCSNDLNFLICSIYTPICMEGFKHSLPPCRSVCERAKAGCAPIMRHYAFSWPERMDCGQFPELNNAEGMLCMERNLTAAEGNSVAHAKAELDRQRNEEMAARLEAAARAAGPRNPNAAALQAPDVHLSCSCGCQPPLVQLRPGNDTTLNKITTLGFENCALPCRSVHFQTEGDRRFVEFWLGLWSVLCAVSTLVTVLTFATTPNRFQYPGQPIIYLSICYFFVSIGYIIRVALGHEAVACTSVVSARAPLPTSRTMEVVEASIDSFSLIQPLSEASAHLEAAPMAKILQFSLSGQAACTSVFLLTYFFGMAASVWWVVLTVTWFLAAGMKWGNEAISKYTQIFHFISWVLPAVQTGIVLMFRAVDGDPVAGLCSVGATNDANLAFHVLLPLVVYTIIGTFFLFAGFIALCRIRRVIKFQVPIGVRTDRLEKLMIKLGIFGLLYTVPAVVVIACLSYELQHRSLWQLGVACSCQLKQSAGIPTDQSAKELPAWHPPVPEYAIFMLKYFMSLIVGITSGFWIWSGKTLASWRRVCFGFYSRDTAVCAQNNYRFRPTSKSLLPAQWQHNANPGQQTVQSPSQFSMNKMVQEKIITHSNSGRIQPQGCNLPNSVGQQSTFFAPPVPDIPTSGSNVYTVKPTTDGFDAFGGNNLDGDPNQQMNYTQTTLANGSTRPLIQSIGPLPPRGLTPSNSQGSTVLTKFTHGSSSGIGSLSLVSSYACPTTGSPSRTGSGKKEDGANDFDLQVKMRGGDSFAKPSYIFSETSFSPAFSDILQVPSFRGPIGAIPNFQYSSSSATTNNNNATFNTSIANNGSCSSGVSMPANAEPTFINPGTADAMFSVHMNRGSLL